MLSISPVISGGGAREHFSLLVLYSLLLLKTSLNVESIVELPGTFCTKIGVAGGAENSSSSFKTSFLRFDYIKMGEGAQTARFARPSGVSMLSD